MSWCVVRAASWLEGCATPGCPAVSDECVEKGSDPCGPRVCLFALSWCQVLLSRTQLLEPPPFRASTTTLWGARGARSLFRTGWRALQRRAGRCGGWVLARARLSIYLQ